MLKITHLTCDFRCTPVGLSSAVPTFGWKLSSDQPDTEQQSYRITVLDLDGNNLVWDSGLVESHETVYIPCGVELLPHRKYRWNVEITDNHGQEASEESFFYSGKLTEPWYGKWIGTGRTNDKKNNLPPELFQRTFTANAVPARAVLYVSALGIYEAELNGRKVGSIYFAPGYTHYQTYLQFQTYDVTSQILSGENDLRITVANGWYLGQIGNKNNNYGNCRGLIAELHMWDALGRHTIIGTDESWRYTADTPLRFADFYNGQTINCLLDDETVWQWGQAKVLPEIRKTLVPHYGAYVIEDQRLHPCSSQRLGSCTIYDFGQNHAGVLRLKVKASKGTFITVRHGEILNEDGSLFTTNLRKAKQTLTLICGRDGIQEFSPRFTYMGFRYAEVTADREAEILSIESVVLTFDGEITGEFSCSDPLLSRFQQNIQWGQRSNFIEIPTDCPQRDERMGWTGDIAVFAATAAFNRDIRLFMKKWLTDLRLDQRRNGTLPVTIPEIKTYQPTPFPVPIAIWGDAATMVPWAVYYASGDKAFLAQQYESMKKYAEAEIRAAARFIRGTARFLWNKNPFQYGDWCAPGESVGQWKRKGKYLATAFFANSVDIIRKAAKELGKADDAARYAEIHENIRNAFAEHCILSDGKLTGDFQSNYACALYFDLVPKERKPAVAARLAELVRVGGHKIQTGFAGTPYIAFALADNGYVEDAYKLLQNTACPSWLYTVKAGGTTVWERLDALDENGHIQKMGKQYITDMVSFNHYAFGAVGDFYYRRILGIEALEAGYRFFKICPVPGGTLSSADGSLDTVYGKIESHWRREKDAFSLGAVIPANTRCQIVLPNGETYLVGSGSYQFAVKGGMNHD